MGYGQKHTRPMKSLNELRRTPRKKTSIDSKITWAITSFKQLYIVARVNQHFSQHFD